MKLPRRTVLHLAAGGATLVALSRVAWAQAYPARPVRIIVGFAPSGATDIMARLIGQWLSERLGQQFIVENRPGAASNIGTEAVVNAPPDGYTLLVVTSVNAINATPRTGDPLHGFRLGRELSTTHPSAIRGHRCRRCAH